VACDSRKVQPGALFFALHGAKADGNAFIQDAIKRGRSCRCQRRNRWPGTIPAGVAWIQVREARKALAITVANFLGHPASALQLVAVTGHEWKDDDDFRGGCHREGLWREDRIVRHNCVSHAARRLSRAKHHAGIGGPAWIFCGDSRRGRKVRRSGGEFAFAGDGPLVGVPFSSCGLHQPDARAHGFHKTFDDYFAAKKRLFEGTGAGAPEVAVLNTDDEFGKRLAGLTKKTVTYGLESDADITTKKFQLTFDGLTFTAHTPNGKVHVVSRLVGRINVYNLLAAIGAAQAVGLSNEVIEKGIRELESVSGRFQRIDLGQPFLVIVDYAHTDDALENLIRTARELNPNGRVITLFGCGGQKDRTKRPVMGEVTGRLSDLTILSSDNPRSEDPLKIISDIIVGLQKTAGKYLIEPDREKAIGMAMDEARSGDIVLLAGKGHENYQILADRTFEFDDRDMARRVLRERGFEGPRNEQGNGGRLKGEPRSSSEFGT